MSAMRATGVLRLRPGGRDPHQCRITNRNDNGGTKFGAATSQYVSEE
jgi:hypothetical protein